MLITRPSEWGAWGWWQDSLHTCPKRKDGFMTSKRGASVQRNCLRLSHGSGVAQLCLTLATCQAPLSMRFSRPTILEWVAISFSSVSLELSKKRASWYINRKSCFQWQTQPQTGNRWHLFPYVAPHFFWLQFGFGVKMRWLHQSTLTAVRYWTSHLKSLYLHFLICKMDVSQCCSKD